MHTDLNKDRARIGLADRSFLKLTLGALLTISCLWLVTRNVDFSEFSRSLRDLRLPWVASALAAYAAGYALRIERWRLMLACENSQLRWIACAGPFFAGYAANNLLPLRAGDAIRALAFTRELKSTLGTIVATLFVERLLDILALLALLGVATTYFGRSASILYRSGLVAIALAAIIAILILRFPRGAASIGMSCAGLLSRIAPRIGNAIQSEIRAGFEAMQQLTSRHLVIRLVLLSALIWFFECLIFWFSALAIPTLIRPISSLLAVPTGTLATLLPSTPGFVGTFEYPIVIAMTTLGNGASAAMAYALLVHALLAVPSVLLGTPYLLAYRSRPRDGDRVMPTKVNRRST